MDGDATAPASARPYRSHKVPACNRCRYRKIRCEIDLPSQPCRFCRESQSSCNYSQPKQNVLALSARSHRPVRKYTRKIHERSQESTCSSRTYQDSVTRLSGATGTSLTQSSLMLNPPMAEDITILERYLTSQSSGARVTSKVYSTISDAPGDAIVYLTVPRPSKGLKPPLDPGRTQREVIEQVLNPFASEVRRLYFEYLHPYFPILDSTTFLDLWQNNNYRLSSTLVCDLYASALLFWNKSEVLRAHASPDAQFIWNQAISALQEDFAEPTISTVHAALLDMVGRPVLQVTSNIVNAGRVVTLAHSLGLHRDPTTWRATTHEKNVRIRLWWGVLIHDHWSSISHGIPPTINRVNYDVPIPSLASLVDENTSESHKRASSSFVHFCKLTQILGDILPYVYALTIDSITIWRNLRKVECALDDWVEDLPQNLKLECGTESMDGGGASNLWFSYLSIKLLLCRLAFKATIRDSTQANYEAKRYRLSNLRDSASEVADFVASLPDSSLHGFWMPYTSYLLVSAATTLLRCIVECTDLETKRNCIAKLVGFRDRLKRAQSELQWDLADFCLVRCNDSIQKIANAASAAQPATAPTSTTKSPLAGAALPHPNTSTPRSVTTSTSEYRIGNEHNNAPLTPAGTYSPGGEGSEAAAGMLPDGDGFSDLFLPTDSLDFPWETLWDNYNGPGHIQI
ncbi:hypothetical protein DM02DRAFT_608589 [Periconia macrospinosa]|uniref:Zn(2)-C6 fungal-type domain-containing protein n=1 Tax=Periconia macrospinosa TaxID=97972 RepID=A0A2V1EBS1_9PLEO|nr:hypothetical protein DM02DRAFT_608589 [Periconia macrospinosa]